MKTLLQSQRNTLLEIEEKKKIYLHSFTAAQSEVEKGNETIKVLYNLLLQEINRHNGVITRKISSIRNQGTTD